MEIQGASPPKIQTTEKQKRDTKYKPEKIQKKENEDAYPTEAKTLKHLVSRKPYPPRGNLQSRATIQVQAEPEHTYKTTKSTRRIGHDARDETGQSKDKSRPTAEIREPNKINEMEKIIKTKIN